MREPDALELGAEREQERRGQRENNR